MAVSAQAWSCQLKRDAAQGGREHQGSHGTGGLAASQQEVTLTLTRGPSLEASMACVRGEQHVNWMWHARDSTLHRCCRTQEARPSNPRGVMLQGRDSPLLGSLLHPAWRPPRAQVLVLALPQVVLLAPPLCARAARGVGDARDVSDLCVWKLQRIRTSACVRAQKIHIIRAHIHVHARAQAAQCLRTKQALVGSCAPRRDWLACVHTDSIGWLVW